MKKNGFYIIAAVIIIVMLATVSITITRTMFGSLSNQPLTKIFFNHLADAILLLAPCWVLKRRRTYTFIIVWLVALWSFIQLLYYPTYRDVMPFSSFLLVKNISPTLLKSSVGAVTKKSLAILLMPLLLHAYHWWLKRREGEKSSPKRHWWMFAASIVAFVVLRLAITASIYLANRQNYSDIGDAFSTRYTKLGGRHLNYIMHNGVMSYAIFSLAKSIDTGVSDEEMKAAQAFIDKNCPKYTDNSHVTAIERPNLIFIMVESLNAWAVNLDIDGKPVTPTLNALAADTAANIVCLNMISQAKNGHSSDGKFMYQTGLLPMLDKSVAMEYSNRNFPSLVKALKQRGYKAVEICGDEASLWNVEGMSQAYGFDTLFHHPELEKELEAADYKIDKVVMDYAATYLPSIKGQFIAQLFTGVMHSPYNYDWQPATWISASKQFTPDVRNYLEKTHYFDAQLAIFLNRLKENGLYDNSVIVIASDHSEPVDDVPQGRPSLSRDANDCVLLVINAREGKNLKGPIGQIDVYPTILDVMGLNSYQWKGVGYSLLRYDVKSAAITPDETVGTSPMLPSQCQAWQVSNTLIRAGKFDY
jgi:phosphoglycerol transferase MdoB-like AlkP superfamily enzyme